jgi:hypothetical protein
VAARQLVEVVDPLEDSAADSFVTEASTTYVSHALGLVKSFWFKARLEVFAQGVPSRGQACS